MKHRLFFVTLFSLFIMHGQAQKNVPVQAPMSDSLAGLAKLMYSGETDIVRYEANDRFMNLLKEELLKPDAFQFAFDSVKSLAVVYPNDKKFKIYTWSLPLLTDKYETYGLMLVFSNKSHTYKVIELRDVSNDIVNAEKEILKKGVWYGAVYYQLIEKKVNGEKLYTVIGWNGGNGIYQQKVVDVITFDRNDDPVFGKLLFRGKGFTGYKRVIYRFSVKVVMKLRFEEISFQVVTKKERKKHNERINQNNDEALRTPKKKTVVKTKTEEMIVFDHLIPLRPELEGQYQFYYPYSEKGNGFVFEDGRWVYQQVQTTDDPKSDRPLQDGLLPK